MKKHVAANVQNTLVPLSLGFCVLTMDPPAASPSDPTQTPIADGLLDGIRVRPLAGAWVMVVPPNDDPKEPWLYVTDPSGVLRKITAAQIAPGQPVPRGESDYRLLGYELDHDYAYFWTQDLDAFRALVAAYARDAVAARADFGVATFRLDTHRSPWQDAGTFIDRLRDLTDPEARVLLALLLHNQGPRGTGWYDALEMNGLPGGFAGERLTRYVFARRPAVSAFYLAQVMTRYPTSLWRRASPSYATFSEVVEAVTSVDKDGLTYRPFAATPSSRLSNPNAYMGWAYACATFEGPNGQRVSRADFQASLKPPPVEPGPAMLDWLIPVCRIWDQVGAKHPAFADGLRSVRDVSDTAGRGAAATLFQGPNRTAADPASILQAFDKWRVGVDMAEKPWFPGFARWLDAAQSSIQAALAAAQARALGVLLGGAGLLAFTRDAALHATTGESFLGLFWRYMVGCLDLEYGFYAPLPEDGPDAVTEDFVRSILLTGGQALFNVEELVNEFFDVNAAMVARTLASDAKSFNKLMRQASTLEMVLHPQKAVEIGRLTFVVDDAQGVVLVKRGPFTFGSFRLARVEDSGSLAVPRKNRPNKVRSKRVTFYRPEVVMEPPEPGKAPTWGTLFEEEQRKELEEIGFSSQASPLRVPRMIGAVGAIVIVAAEVLGFGKAAQTTDQQVFAYLSLGRDAGYAVQSLAEGIEAVIANYAESKLATFSAKGTGPKALAEATAKLEQALDAYHADPADEALKAAAEEAEKAVAAEEQSALGILPDLSKTVSVVGTFVGAATVPLDCILTFREGALIFWGDESAELADARREGRTVEALALEAKGAVYMGGAVAAAGTMVTELVLGAALATAIAPAGLILAGVVLVGMALDFVIGQSGGDEPPIEKAFYDERAAEDPGGDGGTPQVEARITGFTSDMDAILRTRF
jgi:hypothetical protein